MRRVLEKLQKSGVGRIRRALLVLSLIGGTVYFASVVFPIYPPGRWLFFRYLEYWTLSVFWGMACFSCGDAVVRRLHPGLGARERAVWACAAGLLTFVLGMFACGLLGLFGRALFFVLPGTLLLAGGRKSIRFWSRYGKRWLALREKKSVSLISALAAVFGLASLAMVYFNVIVPANVAADSHWYHLPIAEHYVAEHGIHSFREGWYQGALPHLASLIYTWGFLLPIGDLYDRIELCSHLEFVVFLWTLASMPVAIRWTLRQALRHGGRRMPALHSAWAGVFLFPGIMLYDSSVTTAADHVAAFWAIPVILGLGRAIRRPTVRNGAWLGMPLAGAALTKYQTLSILAFPSVAFAFVTLFIAVRRIKGDARERRKPLLALGSMGVTALVLTTPHWLKNFVWYGDPLYPLLYKHLAVHPWTVDSAVLFEEVFKGQQLWTPKGTPAQMLRETALAVFTFSFEPHDWVGFHGNVPVFGSLFTLSLLVLPFLRKAGRAWLVAVAALVGVFLWYWTSHQDRYLQIILPWMVVVTVATIVLAWFEGGVAVRTALGLWIAFQIVWGADVYFIPTHALVGTAPAKATIDLISTGYRKADGERNTNCNSLPKVAKLLPEGAKVLFHDIHDHLGISAATVSDIGPWQGGLSYGRLASPRAFFDEMRALGVTHFYYRSQVSSGTDSYAGDLIFYDFVTHYARMKSEIAGFTLSVMPRKAPADTPWLEATATVVVCGGPYAPGVYRLADLRVPSYGVQPHPRPTIALEADQQVSAFLEGSTFAVFEPSCHPSVQSPASLGFEKLAKRGNIELYVRAGSGK